MKLSRTTQEIIDSCGIWKTKFAWFPTQMDDGCFVWLEKYESQDYIITVPNMGKFVRTKARRIAKVGTNSAGPGGPTKNEKENVSHVIQ